MFLTDLIGPHESGNIVIKGITADSRAVGAGYLFAALPGVEKDGRDFITDAVQRGAVAILSAPGAVVPNGIILIEHDAPRAFLSQIAARFYPRQPQQIAAVTGTNGKTSTVCFAQQIWRALGVEKAATLGTLGLSAPGVVFENARTTPDSVSLHAMLDEMTGRGVTHLAMEASSHGLAQNRMDDVRVSVAAFTNLTHDHLDYHASMDDYFQAKARLFTDVLAPDGVAVLNKDVPEYARLAAMCGTCKIITYGTNDADLCMISRTPTTHGQDVVLRVGDKTYQIHIPLIGAFMAMNVLCAAALVVAEGQFATGDIIAALSHLQGAPGRLQAVGGHPRGAVYIDYAHTPDALDNILRALRPHTQSRLICVFGCGGDRDRTKRPLMGEIAAKLSDMTIVTDDNPRSEDPASIRQAIMAGASGNMIEIGDRRAAIRHAVSIVAQGDVLVIAGKGHEQGQIIGNRTEKFDDLSEAKEAIALLNQEGKRA